MVDDAPNVDHRARRTRRGGRLRPWASPKRILIVNDHFEVRSVITEFLRRRGLIAIPVRDAASARVVCERIELDLILLHVLVLDLAETALIRQVKLLRPAPPIVVVAAVKTPELERDCRALTIDEILVKPIVLRPLERVIARLLKPRQAGP
jgi:two-component system response regulator VanR